jgi:hypothetical protein
MDDPIVIRFQIVNEIGSGKCGCSPKRNEVCKMYEIKIDSILYTADSLILEKVFNTSTFVAPDEYKFYKGQIYTSSFLYSFYEYFIYVKLIKFPALLIRNPIGYVSGNGPCYKSSVTKRILFSLHINRKKLLESRKEIPKEEEYFYKLQNSYFRMRE